METQGRGTGVGPGLGLLAILNKEVKEGLAEKGMPEGKKLQAEEEWSYWTSWGRVF